MAQTIGDSTLLDAWASSGDIVEPDLSKIEQGWLLGEQPPHEFFNWIQNTFGQKINHVLQRGVPSWDSGKSYEVGDVVGSGGSVWIAQAINTNSTPGPINTDWVRVLTADDVATTTDAGIVELATDAETVTGTSSTLAATPSGVSAAITDIVSPATTTEAGIVELATDAETQSGTDATRAVTPSGLNAAVGVDKSWQDFTLSRARNTTYTNSTGRTISVAITSAAVSNMETRVYIDGVQITSQIITNNDGSSASGVGVDYFEVPNESTYRYEAELDFQFWLELR